MSFLENGHEAVFSVAGHRFKVFDDLVGSIVKMLKDSFGVIVSKEDDLGVVDDCSVVLVDDNVIEGLTWNTLSLF